MFLLLGFLFAFKHVLQVFRGAPHERHRTAGSFAVLRSGAGRGSVLEPAIRSQSFGEPVPLDCELLKFSSGFSSPFGRAGWCPGATAGYFRPRWAVRFRRSPAGLARVHQFLPRAELVGTDALMHLRRFFFLFSCQNQGDISDIHCENLVKPL